ncbi:MAG: amidohydrolase family protein [Bacteroidota bacterium]
MKNKKAMISRTLTVFVLFFITLTFKLNAQERYVGPIIDMHLHDYSEESYYVAPTPDRRGMSPPNLDSFHAEVNRMIEKYNIIKGVSSPALGLLSKNREVIVPGYMVDKPPADTTVFIKMIESGEMQIFGEIGAIYGGYTLSDPEFDPYLAICERYNIPVAVHTGGGPPQTAYRCCPNFRLKLGDPFEIEDVLVKYPKLRVYMMHAGEVYYEHALRLMKMYPHLYADLGVLLWVDNSTKDYAESFLRKAKRYGLIDRVLFGSDQMVWPQAIELSIETLNAFDFLSLEDNRKIFYDNAVRFMEWDIKP